MHTEKPEKMDDMWYSGLTTCVMLDKNMFSNVKWEDEEPMPVIAAGFVRIKIAEL